MSLLTLFKPASKRIPTRVQRVATDYTTNHLTKTSPQFNVKSGDLVVVTAVTPINTDVVSVRIWDGPRPETWTLQQSVAVAGYSGVYIWTMEVPGEEDYTSLVGRTVTLEHTDIGVPWGFEVTVWRNHAGVGVSGKANIASGAPSLNLTTSANSAVQTTVADFNKASGASRAWRSIDGRPMLESHYQHSPTAFTIYSGWHPDVGAAGSKTLGLTLPATQKYSIVGVEILAPIVERTAPTFVASYDSTQDFTSTVGSRTASVTAAAGDTLVLLCTNSDRIPATPTGGTGITWTLLAQINYDSNDDEAGSTAWVATVPSPQTFTASVALTNPALQDSWGFVVFRFSGVQSVGRTTAYQSSDAANTYFGTKNVNSAIVMVTGDYSGLAYTPRPMYYDSIDLPAAPVESRYASSLFAYTAVWGYYPNAGWAGPKSIGWKNYGPDGTFIGVELVGMPISGTLNKLFAGSALINALKVGSSNVSKVYAGSTQVWP